MVYDVIVIGAGASGTVAAICAGRHGEKTLLLECSDRIGRKISASGNGRCNLMNVGKIRYHGDKSFAQNVLLKCDFKKQTEFWSSLGLEITIEEEGRVYPASFHSSSVIEVLKMGLLSVGTDIHFNEKVVKCNRINNMFHVCTENGNKFYSKRLIVACGGAAQPKLGGREDGYRIMHDFGHSYIAIHPALTQIITDKRSISGLKGIRVNGTVSLSRNGKKIKSEKGEILFTEYGLSGICVMQLARSVNNGDLLELNFTDHQVTLQDMQKRKKRLNSFKIEQFLDGWFIHKLGYGILKKAGIELRDRLVCDLSDTELYSIAKVIGCYDVTVIDVNGFDSAQVTAGGISCDEIRSDTMESSIVPGLYCTGETLNVDGDCGGYNLMFAFASGILAGCKGDTTLWN